MQNGGSCDRARRKDNVQSSQFAGEPVNSKSWLSELVSFLWNCSKEKTNCVAHGVGSTTLNALPAFFSLFPFPLSFLFLKPEMGNLNGDLDDNGHELYGA